jgi:aspartyl-tRNA synthetase
MEKYGSDKPDLRNPLHMIDVTEFFRGSDFKAFASTVENGGVVRAIRAPKVAGKPRKFFDDMIKFAQENGAKGMAYIIWTEEGEKSPIVKFLTPEVINGLKAAGNVETGDALFFLADQVKLVQKIGGAVIPELGRQLELISPNEYKFCWIVDFPMFEQDEETGETIFSHNPFSMPQGGMEALETKDPLDILAYQYDIVCNGIELSSGAIRNHRPEIMYKAFEIAGYEQSTVDAKFGGMINAFKLGAPPHGGIAPGVDRTVMMLADEPNIREVIAFPFNQQAQDLMMNAPAEVSIKQLRELHLKLNLPKKLEEKKED